MNFRSRPAGITALSLFFLFGTLMSGLAAAMPLFPGSVLEPMWQLNPHGHEGFAAFGSWVVLLMAVVCAACTTAALGLWRCTRWGFWTALAVLSFNLAGDTANALVARDWHTLIGLPIGGVMIVYLLRERRVLCGEPPALEHYYPVVAHVFSKRLAENPLFIPRKHLASWGERTCFSGSAHFPLQL